MDLLLQSFRHAIRSFLRKPGFTLVVVLTLGIGIGACTTMFSVVNAVLLRPLPYSEPERIVAVRNAMPSIGFPDSDVSEGQFKSLHDQRGAFEYLAAWTWGNAALRDAGEPERIKSPGVSSDFFRVLGVKPILGRDFASDEEGPVKNRVVLLSHGFWQRKFGGDRNVVGRAITLDNQSYTIIGVLPRGFKTPDELQFENPVDLWRGLAWNPSVPQRGTNNLSVIGRLRNGATIATAQAEVSRALAGEMKSYPDFYPPDMTCNVLSLERRTVGDVGQSLFILMAAVGAVLLIACANVANLLLVKVEERNRELALRVALGAGRGQLVRMVLAESVLLSMGGGFIGLLLAKFGIELLLAISPKNIPRLSETSLDFRMAVFALVVSLITAIVFGLVPALQSANAEPQDSLKESGRGHGASNRGGKFRKGLIAFEMALAVVLLTSAGLLVRSFQELQKVETGFRTDHLLTMRLTPPSEGYREGRQVAAFYNRVTEQIQTLPGVTAAGVSDLTPLDGTQNNTVVEIEGRPFDMNQIAGMNTIFRTASEGYFASAGMKLVQGRLFEPGDRDTAPLVAIINESFAKRHWPGENPLGKRFRLLDAPPDKATSKFVTVVGVTGDTKNQSITEESKPEAFVPLNQYYASLGRAGDLLEFTVLVRTTGAPVALTPIVQSEIKRIEPRIIFTYVRTLEQVVASTIVLPKFYMALLGVFALISLCLGAIGTYGVISYSVARRTHEIGVRLALGASTKSILRLVIRQGMTTALVGVSIGIAASFGLTRLLKTLLFGVAATDPMTFGSISALLIGVAWMACWLPARRAAKTDPMIALRHE